jgi:hypothetical protein
MNGQNDELLDNLEAWGNHFRDKQHGVTLTILRAKNVIRDQNERIETIAEMLARCEMWLSTAPDGRAMQLECQRALGIQTGKGDCPHLRISMGDIDPPYCADCGKEFPPESL